MVKQVAVYAFDGISPFHLSVPCVVFGDASAAFRVTVCAEVANPITSAGFTLGELNGLEVINGADIVIVPSWHSPYQPPSETLISALQAAVNRNALVVGLCLGSFALAGAGLLDGKRATTHWAYFEDFSARFPKVLVDGDVLFIEQGNVITSAGTAAGLDCCLHIARKYEGSAAANQIARMLVAAPKRQGGQSQYIAMPIPERGGDKRLGLLLDGVLNNLSLPHSIDSLATQAMMSRRTFTRRFQAVFGKSFGQWLLSARLGHCQQLLESTPLDIEQVALNCGFHNATTLRHHFKAAFGISPSQWRKMYRVG